MSYKVILFIIFAALIFYGIHAYVFYRYAYFFNITLNRYILIIPFLIFISYISQRLLIGILPDFIMKYLYLLLMIWLGAIFLFFCTTFIYEIFHHFISLKPIFWGFGLFIFTSILILYGTVNGFKDDAINEIDLQSSKISKDIKIVLLTDLHIDPIRDAEFFKEVILKVNKINPDIILITGDFVDEFYHDHVYSLVNTFNAPVFFSIGNHEIYPGEEKTLKPLENTKTKVLRNEVYQFNEEINIIGVDYSMDKKYLDNLFIKSITINTDKFNILMYHHPSEVKVAAENRIDLMLSGHTHGGQIFPFNLLVKLQYPYIKGFYKINDMSLYVSSGTGLWGPPLRLGTRSEIAVINIIKKN